MSYEKYYNLNISPFSLTPDDRFFYHSKQCEDALVRLLHGVNNRKGLVIMIGEMGAGKTMLAHKLFNGLQEENCEIGMFVMVHGDVTPEWLLSKIAMQMGVMDPPMDKSGILKALFNRLLEIDEQGKKAVIIIDEASMIRSQALFEVLRSLLHFETVESRLISVVLMGLPEFEKNMALDPPFQQRISVKFYLKLMDEEDTRGYVRHRLAVAGNPKDIFSPEAMQTLFRYSKGIPRLLNTICDNCLMEGFLTKQEVIGPTIVELVVRDLGIHKEEEAQGTLDSKVQEIFHGSEEMMRFLGVSAQKPKQTAPVSQVPEPHKKTASEIQKELEAEPNNFTLRFHLAETYLKEGDEEQAKAEFFRAAEGMFDHGDLDQAIQAAQKAVDLKNINGYYIMGLAYLKKRMVPQAKTSLETILRYVVNHEGALLHLALVHQLMGNDDSAVTTFEKVLKFDPSNTTALTSLGNLLVKKGNAAEASLKFMQATRSLMKEQEWNKALDICQKALKIAPLNLMLRNAIIEIYLKKGMPKEASAEMVGLAQHYLDQGDKTHCWSNLISALEHDPSNLNAAHKLKFLLETEPLDESYLSKLSDDPEQQVKTLLLVGDIFVNQDFFEQAFRQYQRALAIRPLNSKAKTRLQALTFLTIGDFFVKIGLEVEAVEQYHKVMELQPEYTTVQGRLQALGSRQAQHRPESSFREAFPFTHQP